MFCNYKFVRSSFFEKTHHNIRVLDTSSKNTVIMKLGVCSLHLSIPIIKGLVIHLILKWKKELIHRMKIKRDSTQNYRDFADFFMNYTQFKTKIKVFNLLCDLNANQFAKQVLRKVYFKRFLIENVIACLKETRNLLRLNDILCTVNCKFKQNLNRHFFKQLIRKFLYSIENKGKIILISLLDEGFEDHHLNSYSCDKPINPYSNFKLHFYDKNGFYIRNIYSNGWFNKEKNLLQIKNNNPIKKNTIYDFFSSFAAKMRDDINCMACKAIASEEVYCKKCARLTWKSHDLIDHKGSEIHFIHNKRNTAFEEELAIHKSISDEYCRPSSTKHFLNLTPSNTNEEKFFAESKTIYMYKINKMEKSPDKASSILDNIFSRISHSKKSHPLFTEGANYAPNDLSKLSKIEDDNKSSISHKKYHSNNSKITATISNALKSINKNTEFKNEIIKIRDNRKDSLYPFINNKLKD